MPAHSMSSNKASCPPPSGALHYLKLESLGRQDADTEQEAGAVAIDRGGQQSSMPSDLDPPRDRPGLPPTWSERLADLLPGWVGEHLRSRRRELLYVERRLQRRFLNEYRAQVRSYEPVLRERGRMVGDVLLDTMTGRGGGGRRRMTYADIVADSLKDTVAERLPLREVVATLDPLINPVLNPFVEGIKEPVLQHVGEIQSTVLGALVATGLACGVAGFVVGRFLPRSGGGRDT